MRLAIESVDTEIVVVHDAARPLAAPALIDAVVRQLRASADAEGVISATAITDTVKRASESPDPTADAPSVLETIDRRWLWAAQTPQAFRTRVLRAAQERAYRKGTLAAATDEAMLLESVGARVEIHPASAENIKITTSEDLAEAEEILGGR